jgi:hypothetical protein
MRTVALTVAVVAFGALASIGGVPDAAALSPARTHTAVLRFPRGRSVRLFRLSAPAAVSYDITVHAPASAALSVVTNVNRGAMTLSVLYSTHDQGCVRRWRAVTCTLHFAEGGNPGGKWAITVTKRSEPSATVALTVTFHAPCGWSWPERRATA